MLQVFGFGEWMYSGGAAAGGIAEPLPHLSSVLKACIVTYGGDDMLFGML
jgi:hypothetical protein